MDSEPSSKPSRKSWRIGVPQVCTTCGIERDYEDFHAVGTKGTRRTECRHCRNPKMARYMRDKQWGKGNCHFCERPVVFQNYCADHWQQYRYDHIETDPTYLRYLKIVKYVAQFFGIPVTSIIYNDSHRPKDVHVRLVAFMVIKHLTNAPVDKLAPVFSKNVSNIIRGLQRARKFYTLYPEFAEDVDGVLLLMKENGEF